MSRSRQIEPHTELKKPIEVTRSPALPKGLREKGFLRTCFGWYILERLKLPHVYTPFTIKLRLQAIPQAREFEVAALKRYFAEQALALKNHVSEHSLLYT